MKKSFMGIFAVVLMISLFAGTGFVSAQTLNPVSGQNNGAKTIKFVEKKDNNKKSNVDKKDKAVSEKETRRTVVGTVSSISGSVFVVTQNKKTFNVNISYDAKITNRSGKTINLSDIQSGDKISASGTFNSSNMTVTASKVKDLSMPKVASKKSSKK